MKLLVRPHVATFGYQLGSYGMQEVRGSNPRSSTHPEGQARIAFRISRIGYQDHVTVTLTVVLGPDTWH